MTHSLARLLTLTTLTTLLAACGGGGGNSATNNETNTDDNTSIDLFSTKGAQWVFRSTDTEAQCYDIDTQQDITCSNTDWDIKAVMNRGTPSLYANGGTSGNGQGAVLYSPLNASWTDLSKLTDATIMDGENIPSTAWTADAYSNAFTQKEAGKISGFLEYDLFGEHKLSPNFKTYLVTTDTNNKSTTGSVEAPVYTVQIYNYYDQVGTSGYISIRYINTLHPEDVRTIDYIDASNDWAYVNLASGAVTNSATTTWQLALNRYSVQTNSSIGSTVATQPEGFYDDNGSPITAAFKSTSALADTLTALKTATTTIPSVRSWTSNAISSLLNPSYQGTYPQALNFGWYTYFPTEETAASVGLQQHMVTANSDAASIIRSNTGNSYARLHLNNITYADPADASSEATWTFELDIQPAQ